MQENNKLTKPLWGIYYILYYILGGFSLIFFTPLPPSSGLSPMFLKYIITIVVFGYMFAGLEIGHKKIKNQSTNDALKALIPYAGNLLLLLLLFPGHFLSTLYLHSSLQFSGIITFVFIIFFLTIWRHLIKKNSILETRRQKKKHILSFQNKIFILFIYIGLLGALSFSFYFIAYGSYLAFLQVNELQNSLLTVLYFLLVLLSVVIPHLKTIKKSK